MQYFSSDGVEIAFRDEGEGDPILLIHGFASTSAVNWDSTGWTRTLLTDGRRVIAMDVRGHGQSEKLYDPEQYAPARMAADAANLLDHLSVSRADVLGYSMGARIAAFLALQSADSVRSFISGGMGSGLVDGIGGEEEIVAALEAPSLEAASGVTGRAYRKFAEMTGGDLRALAACMQGQREPVQPERLAEIDAPVLVAVGSEDDVAGSAKRLADLIPGAEVLDIPGRDHLLATGDKAFKAGVIDFLARRQ